MIEEVNLSFLDDVELDVITTIAPAKKVQVEKIPTAEGIAFRLFPNGNVYPSAAFAAEMDLEFQPRELLEGSDDKYITIGNGLDIFSSEKWGMIKGKLPQPVIFVAPVAKALAKVDMWGSTKYDENNEPKASVFTQGKNVFSERTLVPLIAEVYGVEWDKVAYIDLKVVDKQMKTETEIYNIPKIVAAGKNKGKDDYVRREHIVIKPLVVAHQEPAKISATQVDMFEDDDAQVDDPRYADLGKEGVERPTKSKRKKKVNA
jgi:hypothetical protein